jgi:hypothetical protein
MSRVPLPYGGAERTIGEISCLLNQKKEVVGSNKKLDKLGLLYTVYGEWLFKLRKEDQRK